MRERSRQCLAGALVLLIGLLAGCGAPDESVSDSGGTTSTSSVAAVTTTLDVTTTVGAATTVAVVAAPGASVEDLSTAGCALAAALLEASFEVTGSDLDASVDPDELVDAFQPILDDDALGEAASSVRVEQAELVGMRDAAFAQIRDDGVLDALDELMEVLSRGC